MNKPEYLIIHHFGGTDKDPLFDTSNQTFEIVNEYHKSLWNFKSSLGFYTGYHYIIEKDGKVTQGRADSDVGAHCIGYNDKSIGIAMAGNFDLTLPTEAQIDSIKKLMKKKIDAYGIALENVVPHRKFANKSCYGKNLSDDWAKNLLVDPAKPSREDIINQAQALINQAVALLKTLI